MSHLCPLLVFSPWSWSTDRRPPPPGVSERRSCASTCPTGTDGPPRRRTLSFANEARGRNATSSCWLPARVPRGCVRDGRPSPPRRPQTRLALEQSGSRIGARRSARAPAHAADRPRRGRSRSASDARSIVVVPSRGSPLVRLSPPSRLVIRYLTPSSPLSPPGSIPSPTAPRCFRVSPAERRRYLSIGVGACQEQTHRRLSPLVVCGR
jgi:hypothetical protein